MYFVVLRMEVFRNEILKELFTLLFEVTAQTTIVPGSAPAIDWPPIDISIKGS